MARPRNSIIRKRLIDILFYLGKAHGYELWKVYTSIYSNISNRIVYYHLKVGCNFEEFNLEEVNIKNGDFSWGNSAKELIYSLGKNAKPNPNEDLKEKIEQLSFLKK